MLDKYALLSDEQAVTAAAASTNLIDLLAARQWGTGRPLYVVCVCTLAMTDGSSNSTLAVILETDTTAAFSSATTAQTIGTFAAVSAAGTILGPVALAKFGTAERFLRGYYTPANGDLSQGSFTLAITPDPQDWTAYADGITIS